MVKQEVKDEDHDNSSDSLETTTSIDSDVTNYPWENGRRYHKYKEGSYLLPNDDRETDRMAFVHVMYSALLNGRLHMAPLEDPDHILDIGTGTGEWAVEMADKYPGAKVEGTDLSLIQPEDVPINLRFIIDDASDPWITPSTLYTMVHTRQVAGCFNDFREIIRSAFKNIVAGGYMECHELYTNLFLSPPNPALSLKNTFPQSPLATFIKDIDDVHMEMPQPLRIANKIKRWMEEAGFADVQEQIYEVPITGYPRVSEKERHLAFLNQHVWFNGVNAMAMAPLTRYKGFSREEVELRLIDVRKALSDNSLPLVQKAYIVWGRKPGPQ